jgi:hypothetical protein
VSRTSLRACAAALSLAVVAAPGVALADSLSHSDPAKDVKKLTSTVSGTTTTAAPSQKSADIVHVQAGYTSTRLKETVRLRGLATTWVLTTRIKTPTTHFELDVTRQSGSTSVSLTDGGGVAVTCDGLSRTVSRTRHTVAASVPEECLGSPGWVQVGVGMLVLPKAGGVFFADDGFRKGSLRSSLTLSPKIQQG